MPAIVTNQFRILNASNFVDSVANNNYYVFIGLPNPTPASIGGGVSSAYGRNANWDDVSKTPVPLDSFSSNSHVGDVMMFGKKIQAKNIRRVIRRIDWKSGNRYEIYRDDYTIENPSPIKSSSKLYGADYYVMNEDYKVYICISNGSTGTNPKGNVSLDEPTFTDLEPSKAGSSGDGYIWKYLFTVSPSDIIKFDSTEYIAVPSDWDTTTEPQIRAVRENGDSTVNSNQIKHVYIDNAGSSYSTLTDQEVNIVGDGSGAKARLDINAAGQISNVTVTSGGQGYSYGMVDLDSVNNTAAGSSAKLIPIIPPSRGHGYDIYQELGTDKILIYARFDDSTKDFPTDTKFAVVGIVKNPTQIDGVTPFTQTQFSSLKAIIFKDNPTSSQATEKVTGTPVVGEVIEQKRSDLKIAKAYVASYDSTTKVLKYFTDRSLNYSSTQDQTDYIGVSTSGRFYDFESGPVIEGQASGFKAYVNDGYSGITTNPTGNKQIDLGSNFVDGFAQSEINKGSGDLVYIDHRPLIARNLRQKEDVKIILEF